jgi:hypothetical protein
MTSWLMFAIAVLAVLMIPIAPQLLRFRIKIMRWVHWDWAGNVLEQHFEGWVRFIRIVLALIAAALIYFGWQNLGG